MRRGPARLFALLWVTLLVSSCDKKNPFAPEDDAALSALNGGPPSIAATAVSTSQIDLAWQDLYGNETGFELERSTTGAAGPFASIVTTSPNVTTYSDISLTASTQYCYRLRSFRRTGKKVTYSPFSTAACATTLAPPLPPPGPIAPSSLNARPANGLFRAAQVSWTDNSSDEEGFRVQRGPSEQGPWELAAPLSPNTTSHIDYGRQSEEQLCYRVVAFKGPGESPSNVDCTYLPSLPSGLTAAVVGSAVDLTWADNSAHEDGYEIERSETGGWPFTVVGSVGANTTTYRDATVALDKTYTYRVWVTAEGSRAGSSNDASVVTASSPPAAPSQLNATPVGSTTILVLWTDNSANETGFRLERSENGGASWVTATTTPYAGFWDYERESDEQVCYRAIAFNTVGDSPASNMECVAPPAAPTNLVATTAPGLAIDLTWNDNSSVEEGYTISQRLEDCGYYYGCSEYYNPIATVGPNVTTYRHANLEPGQYNAYVVVAVKDGGESDKSNVASAATELPPNSPSDLRAVAVSSARIDLTWIDNSTNETTFVVGRCTGTAATCGEGDFEPVTWVAANITAFSDIRVQPSTTYTYRVVSCNIECSAPSNKATASSLP